MKPKIVVYRTMEELSNFVRENVKPPNFDDVSLRAIVCVCGNMHVLTAVEFESWVYHCEVCGKSYNFVPVAFTAHVYRYEGLTVVLSLN